MDRSDAIRLVVFEYVLPTLRRERLQKVLARFSRHRCLLKRPSVQASAVWRQAHRADTWAHLKRLSEHLLEGSPRRAAQPRHPEAVKIVTYGFHALQLEQSSFIEVPCGGPSFSLPSFC